VTRARDVSTPTALVLLNSTTFTATSTININSCFSDTYENYRVMVSFSNLNSSTVTFRFRTGTTDNSTGGYIGRFFGTADAATGATRNSNATAFYTGDPSTYGGQVIEILSPQKAQRTHFFIASTQFASAASGVALTGGGMFNGDTVFDGFSLLGTANMTGTIRIYGMRN